MIDENQHIDEHWDAGDMGCGELLMQLSGRVKRLKPANVLRLVALDPGAVEDIPAWCKMTGHRLLSFEHPQYLIERRSE